MLQFHDQETKRSAVGVQCGNKMKVIHSEDSWVHPQ